MNQNAPSIRLTVTLAALTAALCAYVGMTYIIPVPQRPLQPLFVGPLAVVALGEVLVGLVLEKVKLGAARSPGEVLAAAIVSAALGEAVAVYGLLVFLMYGQRQWFFFLVAFAYFVGLWARRPAFLRRMDELGGA